MHLEIIDSIPTCEEVEAILAQLDEIIEAVDFATGEDEIVAAWGY